LSKVKTDRYDLDLLEHEILDALSRSDKEVQGRLLEPRAAYTPNYLVQWFAPPALEQLLRYKAVICDYHYQDVLKVILSRAARSARLTTHFDLDFPEKPQTEPYQCYKHSRICQPTRNARQFLKRYSLDTIKRIREFAAIQTDAKAEVVCNDSRHLRFPECDLVLTSPPYVGLIDYHEQHRYAYELLGLSWKADEEIGAASQGNSQKAEQIYLNQIEKVFINLKQYLSRDARLVVVVHDRKHLYRELSERLGFQTEVELHRQVNRRTGRRAGEFFERIFVWRP
jgi:hypothetical protein